MSSFYKDTKLIDEKLNIEIATISGEMLKASFLLYYIHPLSNNLMVVLKRSILPGAYSRTGRKMGLTVLSTELPEDKPLTIEEAFKTLNIPANIQNAIPFGGIMPNPEVSNAANEMVLVQIDPPEFIDDVRGLMIQEIGQFEIGVVDFKEILGAIQENFIQDAITRLMLSELYILAVEEAHKQSNGNVEGTRPFQPGDIGGGANHPQTYAEDFSTGEKTSAIPDDIISQNSQLDFGAIYSQAKVDDGFNTIIK